VYVVVLVTGATGLIGANVVEQLTQQDDRVRVLVRPGSDASALELLGAEVVRGDITSEEDVHRAAADTTAVINSAAVLGGVEQDLSEHLAANTLGSRWCYDAAARSGAKVVELTTTPFLRSDITLTERPEVVDESTIAGDNYAISKGRAFVEGRERAEAGEDICFVIPGGTYGPSPVVERALAPTSYNRILRGALRGKVPSYAAFPVPWVLAADVARIVVAALNQGEPGLAYIAFGTGPAISTAAFLNLACEAAGVTHRTDDVLIEPGDDAALARYGPTIYEMATRTVPDPFYDDSLTRAAFDVTRTPVADGTAQTVSWLREHGQI
jgi:nucleoside-diphosphate-sugar epimerase